MGKLGQPEDRDREAVGTDGTHLLTRPILCVLSATHIVCTCVCVCVQLCAETIPRAESHSSQEPPPPKWHYYACIRNKAVWARALAPATALAPAPAPAAASAPVPASARPLACVPQLPVSPVCPSTFTFSLSLSHCVSPFRRLAARHNRRSHLSKFA